MAFNVIPIKLTSIENISLDIITNNKHIIIVPTQTLLVVFNLKINPKRGELIIGR
jgi:hypothetical protein